MRLGSRLNVASSTSTKTGTAPDAGDRAGSREERVRRGEHFIAGTDIESHQSQRKGVRSGSAADRVLRAGIRRNFRFQGLDLVAQNEFLGIDHARDLRQDFIANLFMLRLQVEQGNLPFIRRNHVWISCSCYFARANHFARIWCRRRRRSGIARSAAALEIERDAAGAHPAARTGRVAVHQSVIGNVAGDHRPGADERIAADRRAAHHRAIGTERRALAYQRGAVFVLAGHVAARVHDVGEDHRRPAEYVVFQNAAGINRNIVLNFDVIADHHVRGNHHVLADVAVGADAGILHHMREMPDFRAWSNGARLIDVARFVHKIVLRFHSGPVSRIIGAIPAFRLPKRMAAAECGAYLKVWVEGKIFGKTVFWGVLTDTI